MLRNVFYARNEKLKQYSCNKQHNPRASIIAKRGKTQRSIVMKMNAKDQLLWVFYNLQNRYSNASIRRYMSIHPAGSSG